jgi:hypothetical protein
MSASISCQRRDVGLPVRSIGLGWDTSSLGRTSCCRARQRRCCLLRATGCCKHEQDSGRNGRHEADHASWFVSGMVRVTSDAGETPERTAEDCRKYVKVDVESIAEEWEQRRRMVGAPGGRVWVFATRA